MLAQYQIEVGAVGAERWVVGEAEFGACLPPAVLAAHNVRIEAGVQAGTGADAAVGCFEPDPIAGGDPAGQGSLRMQLDPVGRARGCAG
jgi:hypothetical protein